MSDRNFYRGKYKLDKTACQYAKSYALQYPRWCKEIVERKDDPAEKERLIRRIGCVEQAAADAAPEIYPYLLLAVTRGMSYQGLYARYEIPCSRDAFLYKRRKFYWILYQKIK